MTRLSSTAAAGSPAETIRDRPALATLAVVLILGTMIGGAAHAQGRDGRPGESADHVPTASARAWRGAADLHHRRVVVDLVTVTLRHAEVGAGSVADDAGRIMAFLLPGDGTGLLTSTWVPTVREPDRPTVVWSDGTCPSVEVLREKRPAGLAQTAPWLVLGLRDIDGVVLSHLDGATVAGWAVDELLRGLDGTWPERVTDEPLDMRWSTDPPAGSPMPDALASRWDEIVARYLSTTDLVDQIEALRCRNDRSGPEWCGTTPP